MAEKKNKSGISAGNGSVVVGGNVQGSSIVVGNNNTVSSQSVNVAPLFEQIYVLVDKQPDLPLDDKEDVKAELQEAQIALEEPTPDEGFIARRFRNIKRMSPEIAEVAIKTLQNPIGGVVEVVKRIAQKMAEDANK
ncbi:MAG: hypothetical protein PHQ36_14000 [Anaerolineales bacterium]|nr:hypothetical protein [Anaerolineales bacterium]